MVVVVAISCLGCNSRQNLPEQGQHARSISDDKTGEQLLLNGFKKWFSSKSPDLQAQPIVTTDPVGASKSFKVDSTVRDGGGKSGSITIDVTRPTITQSTPDCSSPSSHQCEVTHVENYTVMSSAGSQKESDNRQFSIEVYDQYHLACIR